MTTRPSATESPPVAITTRLDQRNAPQGSSDSGLCAEQELDCIPWRSGDVAHLWIVDSGTNRVYQYIDAVNRTSRSQAAASVFALAAGNTNPSRTSTASP